jgi:hypothetical protein
VNKGYPLSSTEQGCYQYSEIKPVNEKHSPSVKHSARVSSGQQSKASESGMNCQVQHKEAVRTAKRRPVSEWYLPPVKCSMRQSSGLLRVE